MLVIEETSVSLLFSTSSSEELLLTLATWKSQIKSLTFLPILIEFLASIWWHLTLWGLPLGSKYFPLIRYEHGKKLLMAHSRPNAFQHRFRVKYTHRLLSSNQSCDWDVIYSTTKTLTSSSSSINSVRSSFLNDCLVVHAQVTLCDQAYLLNSPELVNNFQ